MKHDLNLTKMILQTLSEYDSYCVPLTYLAQKVQNQIGETEPFSDKFVGHFFLAKDAHLIEELGVCFFTGQSYKKPVVANNAKVRITAQGLEFLDALKNDNIVRQIKDFSFSTSNDDGKSIMTKYITLQLGH